MRIMQPKRIVPQRFDIGRDYYMTQPYFDHDYEDVRNKWKRPSMRYDFMRNVFMPSLGLEGLSALPVELRYDQVTNLNLARDYATARLGQAVALVTTTAGNAAKASAIKQYNDIISWINYDIANPPGGAWEKAELEKKVAEMRSSLYYADRSLGQAMQAAQATIGAQQIVQQAAVPPVILPGPVEPVPSPESDTMKTVAKIAIGAGAAIALWAILRRS